MRKIICRVAIFITILSMVILLSGTAFAITNITFHRIPTVQIMFVIQGTLIHRYESATIKNAVFTCISNIFSIFQAYPNILTDVVVYGSSKPEPEKINSSFYYVSKFNTYWLFSRYFTRNFTEMMSFIYSFNNRVVGTNEPLSYGLYASRLVNWMRNATKIVVIIGSTEIDADTEEFIIGNATALVKEFNTTIVALVFKVQHINYPYLYIEEHGEVEQYTPEESMEIWEKVVNIGHGELFFSCSDLIRYLLSRFLVVTFPYIYIYGHVVLPWSGNLTQIFSRFNNITGTNYTVYVTGISLDVSKAVGVVFRTFGRMVNPAPFTRALVIGWGSIQGPVVYTYAPAWAGVVNVSASRSNVYVKEMFFPTGVKDIAVTLTAIKQMYSPPIDLSLAGDVVPGSIIPTIFYPPSLTSGRYCPGTCMDFYVVVGLHRIWQALQAFARTVTGVFHIATTSMVALSVRADRELVTRLVELIDNPHILKLSKPDVVPGSGDDVISFGMFGVPETTWRYLTALPIGLPEKLRFLWEGLITTVLGHNAYDMLMICAQLQYTTTQCRDLWYRLMRDRSYLDAVRREALRILMFELGEAKSENLDKALSELSKKTSVGISLVAVPAITISTQAVKNILTSVPGPAIAAAAATAIFRFLIAPIIDYSIHPEWGTGRSVFYDTLVIPFAEYETPSGYSITVVRFGSWSNLGDMIRNLEAVRVRGLSDSELVEIYNAIKQIFGCPTNPPSIAGQFCIYPASSLIPHAVCVERVNGTCTRYVWYVDTSHGRVEVTKIIDTGVLVINFVTATESFLDAFLKLIHLEHKMLDTSMFILTQLAPTYVKYREITNPRELAELVENSLKTIYGKVVQNVTCIPERGYARCWVYFSVPVRFFRIRGLEHFIVSGRVGAWLMLVRPCQNITIGGKHFGYLCGFHYTSPRNFPSKTLFRIEKIALISIPSPVVLIERKWHMLYPVNRSEYNIAYVNKTYMDTIERLYGNTTVWQVYERYGDMFNLNMTRTYRGRTYDYFVTNNRTKIVYLDPTNGGMLEPCKYYYFYVWNRLPPDVGIVGIYVNGSFAYSSIPHDVRVALYGTVSESVTVEIDLYGVVNRNGTLIQFGYPEKHIITVNVTPGRTVLSPRVQIGKFMSKLLSLAYMLFGGRGRFNIYALVIAKIVHAKYDYLKSNDIARTLISLPPINMTPAILIVHVYDAVSGAPIKNALVSLYEVPGYVEVGSNYTNVNGTAIFQVYLYHRYEIDVSASGYATYRNTITITNTTTILNVPLSRNMTIGGGGGGLPPVSGGKGGRKRTYYPVTVTVVYEDGSPFQGAKVRIVNDSSGSVIAVGVTDVEGRYVKYIPENTMITVTVTARVDGTVYVKSWKHILVNKPISLVYVVPTYGNISIGRQAILVVYSYDPVDGRYVSHVCFVVYNSTSIIARECTSINGTAVVRGLWTGEIVKINITEVPQGYYVVQRQYTVKIVYAKSIFRVLVYPRNVTPTSAVVYVQVLWNNSEPVTGAVVEIYNSTSHVLIVRGLTNSYGEYIVEVPYGAYIDVHVIVNRSGISWESWRKNIHVIYSPTVVRFVVPYLPKPSGNALLRVYVYDVVNRRPVDDVTVNIYRIWNGEVRLWARCVTNSNGTCSINVLSGSYYGLNISSRTYMIVLPLRWEMYETYVPPSVNEWNVTLSVVPRGVVLLPPNGNKTEPRLEINGTVYDPVNVRVMYEDGVGVSNAFVNVTDLDSGVTIYYGHTDSDGRIPTVYVRNGTHILITVRVDRYNWTESREVLVNCGLLLVFVVPRRSVWYQPEVGIAMLQIVVHAGLSEFNGKPVQHMYRIALFTNTPQNVTVMYTLYKIVNGSYIPVKSWNVTYSLYFKYRAGTAYFYFIGWFSTNFTEPTCIRLRAEIVKYENDTDRSNNVAWSNIVCLRPSIDMYISISYRVIRRLRPGIPLNDIRIFPGDVVEVSIHIYNNLNITLNNTPIRLWIRVTSRPHGFTVLSRLLNMTVSGVRTVVRNFTFIVPWDDEFTISAGFTSPLDNYYANNVVNITLPVAYDVDLYRLDLPRIVLSGSTFRVTIHLMKNVFNTTAVVIVNFTDIGKVYKMDVRLNGDVKQNITVTCVAPSLGILTRPYIITHVVVRVVTVDDYPENNIASGTVTILARKTALIAVIAVGLLILALILAAAHHHHHMKIRKSRKMFRLGT